MSAVAALDTTALDAGPTAAQVDAYRAAHRAGGGQLPELGRRTPGVLTPIGWTALAVGAGSVFGTIAGGVLDVPSALVVLPCWLVAVTVGVRVVRRRLAVERPWAAWARCDAFARANGMVFTPFTAHPAGPGARPAEGGVVFGVGSGRATLMGFERPAGALPRLGTGLFTTTIGDGAFSEGRTVPPRWWTFVVLGLGERAEELPRVVLDATGNDQRFLGVRINDLPGERGRHERLALGGELDRLLRVHAPLEDHARARALLTPGLVAVLLDPLGRGPGTVDAEVTGGELFLYWEGELFLDRASVWRTLEECERRLRAALPPRVG